MKFKANFCKWMAVFRSKQQYPLLFQLLCKKFEYPVGGDINYSAFIQSIDSGKGEKYEFFFLLMLVKLNQQDMLNLYSGFLFEYVIYRKNCVFN